MCLSEQVYMLYSNTLSGILVRHPVKQQWITHYMKNVGLSVPTFVWKESGKPSRKTPSQYTRTGSNPDLTVVSLVF
ncbi:unnamed protein product [Timema podura]|uniref:Uncharacterized protein n=1 Tax=Timema podura TaxID=61482 RepID=A0ABN7NRQ1_TIMPD|nr:unnamed protein product [Timema podura]